MKKSVAARTTVLDIIDGPSKFDLMISLFGTQGARPAVEFKVAGGIVGRVRVEIRGVSREGSTDESWSLTGFMQPDPEMGAIWLTGSYSTSTRGGKLKYDF